MTGPADEPWTIPMTPAQTALIEYGVSCMRYAEIPWWQLWREREKTRRQRAMVEARMRVAPYLAEKENER